MEFLRLALAFLKALVFKLGCMIFSSKSSSKSLSLPPSPRAVPLLGHLHLLGKLPHQSLQKLASRYGDVMLLKLGSHRTLVISSAEAAREVLKTHDHVFSSRPSTVAGKIFGYGGAGLVWAPYGEHWRTVRKLCTLELLTAKRVETSHPVRKREMAFVLDELSRHQQSDKQLEAVDLTTKLSDLTFNIMTKVLMNKSYLTGTSAEKEAAVRFKDLLTEAFVVGTSCLSDSFSWLAWVDPQARKMERIHQQQDAYLCKQIAEHRQQPGSNGDFLDVMLAMEELSDTSIKSLSQDILAAGTDTTAVTVEWALSELVNDPALLRRAQEELTEMVGDKAMLDESDLPKLRYLQAVVKETLRLHPAGPLLLPHESTEACVLENYTIPAKTRVIVNAYAIARDPRWWDEPLKFDPERFLEKCQGMDVRGQSFEYLPFGSGRRGCPGVTLGMTTVMFILANLIHVFDWKLASGEEMDMTEAFGVTVPRASPFKLVPSSRRV
ncbi:cytochrome P450 71A1-like [Selaginella moellendorffii]|uniref:cytochrome P450 71A1-like n=1 Tax=Selaginella moellendorffii TaxID=88036 RepID=UPI000D1CB659|nr:cytochrome P450 71A1-like [Selaginella moellendorffii]|eukprot:XP_024534554.1 cytochrome P450 71A1-like [Selaginella moellendorffii]